MLDEMKSWRQDLHKIPEIGLEEYETSKYIKNKLKEFNINFKEVSGKFMDNPYFSLTAMPLEHRINCNGYLFQEKDRLRIDKKKLSKLKLKKEDFKKFNLLTWSSMAFGTILGNTLVYREYIS